MYSVPDQTIEDVLWSPDGRHLAFTQWQETAESNDPLVGGIYITVGHGELWLMRPNGADARYLTTVVVSPYAPFKPAWSPDSTTIAVIVDDDQTLGDGSPSFTTQVDLIEVDTGDVRQLPNIKDQLVLNPVWSPDSTTTIVVATEGAARDAYTLWFTKSDGSNPVRPPREVVPMIKTDVTNPSVAWIPRAP